MTLTQSLRALGLALFLGSLALLVWWWTARAGAGGPGGGMWAAVVDAGLFSVFALHHSVLARLSARRLVGRVVPEHLIRTSYVMTASVLLAAMCALWRPTGGTVYRVEGALAMLLTVLQVAGVVVGALAVRRISVRELAGLTDPRTDDRLEYGGPYRFVRHPLYLGWVLVVGCTPNMTGDRLVFALVSTAYLIIAMPFEEAGLIRQFGKRYLEYRQTVRWRLIPYIH